MSETLPTVIQAFAAVQEEIVGVGKDGRNTQQNYNFRGIDGVMNAVGPALRKHGVVITPSLQKVSYRDIEVGQKRTTMREVTVEVEYVVRGPAGDTFSGVVPGESMDSGDKGTAKAMSVAYRIFLLQGLTIPTHEPDPDESSYERSPAREPEPLTVSKDNAEALVAKCEEAGVDVAEVVKLGTDGRTDDPYAVLRSEVSAVKAALDDLAPAPGEAVAS